MSATSDKDTHVEAIGLDQSHSCPHVHRGERLAHVVIIVGADRKDSIGLRCCTDQACLEATRRTFEGFVAALPKAMMQ